MSKTTFAGICLGVPAVMFFILFLIGKLTEMGFLGGLGVIVSVMPFVQGRLSKDEDGIDWAEIIEMLKEQIEQNKLQMEALMKQIEELKNKDK